MTGIMLALLGEVAQNHAYLVRIVRRQQKLLLALSIGWVFVALMNLAYMLTHWL
jgi:hypothetical protein